MNRNNQLLNGSWVHILLTELLVCAFSVTDSCQINVGCISLAYLDGECDDARFYMDQPVITDFHMLM